ncbi:MAG: protoglobin domain-containing protein [Kofleriaceae bacterium]
MTTFLDELMAYVGFSNDDMTRLAALHPLLAPVFPQFAERFYTAVRADPKAAAILSGPEQAERLRRLLIDWMSSGLLGPHDEKFYEKRSRIGRRHVQIGLPQQYMFTAMSVVRTAYHDCLFELQPLAEAAASMRAANKLLDIELAIMVRHYQLDSNERLIARERKLQAERISSMRTMTAGLAHEVRNPLNAAKLQLELLDRRLRREGSDPRLTQPAELAQTEIDRLTILLNDFLAFARPPELQPQDRDVAQIVRHVCELEAPNAQKRAVALVTDIPEAPIMARVDGPKVHQLVDNIVRNAVEAAPEGGHVAVSLAATHDEIAIVVEDDGPGIPVEIQARIYEPFFTTKDTGTGLGMSIVHSLVSLHEGAITLDSSATGTKFTVTLPRRLE